MLLKYRGWLGAKRSVIQVILIENLRWLIQHVASDIQIELNLSKKKQNAAAALLEIKIATF